MEDVLRYIARMMGISRDKARELTRLTNDALGDVLEPGHTQDQSLKRKTELEQQEAQVNLDQLATRLHVPVKELRSWTEDGMIFIEFGDNLLEGVASEGPTALSAIANFYCRWYNDVILKQQPVLLSDGRYHWYTDQGENN